MRKPIILLNQEKAGEVGASLTPDLSDAEVRIRRGTVKSEQTFRNSTPVL